jgi:hypothetical protein
VLQAGPEPGHALGNDPGRLSKRNLACVDNEMVAQRVFNIRPKITPDIAPPCQIMLPDEFDRILGAELIILLSVPQALLQGSNEAHVKNVP